MQNNRNEAQRVARIITMQPAHYQEREDSPSNTRASYVALPHPEQAQTK
jgi:hypothetical protein